MKAKLLNLVARRKIARETQATLNAAKATIEAACGSGLTSQGDGQEPAVG